MDLPDIGRYRRRFIVEFGPEDSGLVDRVGEVYKTKRAAIIAGLRLLDSGEIEQLRARLAALEPSCSAREALEDKAKAVREEAGRGAGQGRSAREARGTRSGPGRGAARQDCQCGGSARECRTDRRAGPPERSGPPLRLLRLLRQARARVRMGRASRPRRLCVYHKPDGYRAKGSLVGGGASVLFWRAKSLLASRDGSSQ